MGKFGEWALRALAAEGVAASGLFADLPEIADLLAAAHAPTGYELRNHLRFTEGEGANEAERTLEGYRRLRKLTGCERFRNEQGRVQQGLAGKDATVEPPDERFVGLPGYPRDGPTCDSPCGACEKPLAPAIETG